MLGWAGVGAMDASCTTPRSSVLEGQPYCNPTRKAS